MIQEYSAEIGLRLLDFIDIRLEECEKEVFRKKWPKFYNDSQPYKNDASHRALLTAYTLVTGTGILTDDVGLLLSREDCFDTALSTTGLQERLDAGIPLSTAMQREESN